MHILIDEAGHACLSGFALSTIRLWVAAKDARLQEADHSPRTSWNSLARMARESFDRETDAYCFGVAMFEVGASTLVIYQETKLFPGIYRSGATSLDPR